MRITRLELPRCSVGEGPVWDVAEQALYYIDILEKRVLRWDPASGEQVFQPLQLRRAEHPAFLARHDGIEHDEAQSLHRDRVVQLAGSRKIPLIRKCGAQCAGVIVVPGHQIDRHGQR